MADRKFSLTVVSKSKVQRKPRSQVSHVSITKKNRSKIIRVAVRSGSVVHPEVKHHRDKLYLMEIFILIEPACDKH
jgi:hypothetical protein